MLTLGLLSLNLQVLFAVALRRHVLGRDVEDVGERGRHRLGPLIRQGQVRQFRPYRIRVTLNQEGLAGFSLSNRCMASATILRKIRD
jgi:hypothetical protein